jgi:hypothetical protein
MDSVLNVLILAAVGLAIFLVVGFIGFKIPAPLVRPPGELTGPVDYCSAPDSLPPAARRWLFADSQQAPVATSLAAWGRGWIASRLPIVGRIWLPLSWTMYLVPGASFIVQNRVTWFTRRFIHGGEEFRGGKGAFLIGKGQTPNDFPYLDETERALAWFYSIWLAPASLVEMGGVRFAPGENGNLAITVHQVNKSEININLQLDAQTSMLASLISTRKGSKTGGDYPFQAAFSQVRSFEGAGQIPTHYIANWDNDEYLKLELAGIQLNQDITDPLQIGLVDLSQA